MNYKALISLLATTLLFASCSTGPDTRAPSYDFPTSGTTQGTLDSWFSENADSVDYRASLDAASPIAQVFALAEVAYWDGDLERAGELYLRMLQAEPTHPLNRFSAARLYALRDEMVDFHARIEPAIRDIRMGEVQPLARVYLSLLAQKNAWHRWKLSDDETPFSGDALGFPSRWMTTPVLSHWRLLDFEHAFEAERHTSLRDEYLSPRIAEDVPENYERSKPFVADGLTLSPSLDSSGIYYLETFATVEPSSSGGARDFLLYGSFAGQATVWIDGQKVLERREGDYGTGKRLRRVSLPAGKHRVLVKLAYQKNYRDWFDLAFLADEATPLADSGISFDQLPADNPSDASVELLGDQMLPWELEPVLVEPGDVEAASDMALFLSANAAYMDLDPRFFDAAINELLDRHDSFAPAHILRAKQVQTLWEVPSDIRDSRSISDLRRARSHAPHNIDVATRLVGWLREQGKSDREVRQLLEDARDAALTDGGELRNLDPLVEWADWLSDQGWSESAEKAWRRALEIAPTHCRSARELQRLYHDRSHYPEPAEITPAHDQCPRLAERLAEARPERDQQRRDALRKRAARYPYNSSAQLDYVDELIAQGRDGEAKDVLLAARERMPWSLSIWNKLANQALAEDGSDAAAAVLDEAIAQNGNSGWLQWRLALLDNDIPLRGLIRDGVELARRDIERGTEQKDGFAGDEAYYALDFAARKYFPDGSSITLTHVLARVMTKNAIDRFGEFSAPSDARLVVARTIKQDGSTRAPEYTSGKSALSMPGLAPGDFVETAYLQYLPPSRSSKTQRDGMRFFFRMANISSLHSEYVVLGTDGEFARVNDAPRAEQIETPEGPAVRFLRTDSPRPRNEPSMVGSEEFLPWIQLHRKGTSVEPFEVSRRSVAEQIHDSLKVSRQLRAQIDAWRADLEPGSVEEIKGLFYRVAERIPDPSMNSFGRDASHAYLKRDGNTLLLLKAAYDQAGISSEIYRVKSKFQAPREYAMGEFGKYRSALLKVEMPGGDSAWVSPAGPDAMFGSIGLSLVGQPAVCVSCEEPHTETVPARGHRDPSRHIDVTGQLSADGTLSATMTMTYHGVRAYVRRRALRQRTDENKRRKYIDLLVSSQVDGASLESFEIEGEDRPDEPLVISARFERSNFARQSEPGVMQVETALFREPVASNYASLPSRTTPMIVGHQRDHHYGFNIELPDGFEPTLRSQEGSWQLDDKWGSFTRSVELEDGKLTLDSSLRMPIQRVMPADYAPFQSWAVGVEQGALLFLTLTDQSAGQPTE
ncbi:MAG: hypothetical protein ACLFVJ_04535 [Persicimonas sp.]